jgi:hypothetical protein
MKSEKHQDLLRLDFHVKSAKNCIQVTRGILDAIGEMKNQSSTMGKPSSTERITVPKFSIT